MTSPDEVQGVTRKLRAILITALSHSPWLFVIARNSSFAYRGAEIDVKQVSRELGVRYILEGRTS